MVVPLRHFSGIQTSQHISECGHSWNLQNQRSSLQAILKELNVSRKEKVHLTRIFQLFTLIDYVINYRKLCIFDGVNVDRVCD